MIERVLNVSGVFLATGARTTEEQSNFEPMDLHATITTQFPSAFENGSYLPSSYRLAAKLASPAPRDTFVYQAKPSSNIIALDTSAVPNDVKMPPIILGQPGTPNPNLGLEFRNTLVSLLHFHVFKAIFLFSNCRLVQNTEISWHILN